MKMVDREQTSTSRINSSNKLASTWRCLEVQESLMPQEKWSSQGALTHIHIVKCHLWALMLSMISTWEPRYKLCNIYVKLGAFYSNIFLITMEKHKNINHVWNAYFLVFLYNTSLFTWQIDGNSNWLNCIYLGCTCRWNHYDNWLCYSTKRRVFVGGL